MEWVLILIINSTWGSSLKKVEVIPGIYQTKQECMLNADFLNSKSYEFKSYICAEKENK